ncbi:MAG: DUF3592 domain-containing protein [Victivallaceae bacterium]|nr:DUF3592 domain-containing protein [Victivallaceae bacterium]
MERSPATIISLIVMMIISAAICVVLIPEEAVPGRHDWRPTGATVSTASRCADLSFLDGQYTWNGKEYHFSGSGAELSAPLLDVLKNSPGAEIKCFVDADNPQEVLITNSMPEIPLIQLLLPAALFIMSSAALVAMAAGPRPVVTDSRKIASRARTLSWLCAGLFLLVGAGTLLIGLHQKARHEAANNWRETPCTILYSSIREVLVEYDTDDNNSKRAWMEYYIDACFKYEADGHTVLSDQYQRVETHSSNRLTAENIIKELPAMSQGVCYVNPANPVEAVLAKTKFSMLIYILIGAGLTAAGLLLALVTTLSRGRNFQNWD